MYFILRFLPVFLLYASVAYASGDNAYRCKNPDNTVDEDWKATEAICDKLGADDCYCSHWAEYYCDPYGDNIDKFKKECEAKGGNWYWSDVKQGITSFDMIEKV
jgi:hypothetical protein